MLSGITQGFLGLLLISATPAMAQYSNTFCMEAIDKSEQGMIETFRLSRQLSQAGEPVERLYRAGMTSEANSLAKERVCPLAIDYDAHLYSQRALTERMMTSCLATQSLAKIKAEYDMRIDNNENLVRACSR